MIISASYKTDIPAFYSRWFLNRLDAGFCQMTNPYNNLSRKISLFPKDVDAIIFWTKNVSPMLSAFESIAERGHFFFIQYTITNYPRELETSVTRQITQSDTLNRSQKDGGEDAWSGDTIPSSSLATLL